MPLRKHRITVTLDAPIPIGASTIARWVRDAAATVALPAGRITVTAVTPATSRQLNHRYRRRDRPTNVLSFRYDPPIDGCLGELIICPAVIKREAPTDLLARTKFLLQHGCIHLLGLDHHTAAEQRRWERYERRFSS